MVDRLGRRCGDRGTVIAWGKLSLDLDAPRSGVKIVHPGLAVSAVQVEERCGVVVLVQHLANGLFDEMAHLI